jgi:hypothetical protein
MDFESTTIKFEARGGGQNSVRKINGKTVTERLEKIFLQ